MMHAIRSKKIVSFSLVAGVGWLLDVLIFSGLVLLGEKALFANLFSALVGVSYCYFISTRKIFYYQGDLLFLKFFLYVIYNFLAILFFSSLIQWLVALEVYAVFAKIIVTPFTFYLNFIAMGLLLNHKLQFI